LQINSTSYHLFIFFVFALFNRRHKRRNLLKSKAARRRRRGVCLYAEKVDNAANAAILINSTSYHLFILLFVFICFNRGK